MKKIERFAVFIFPDIRDLNTENGDHAMRSADNPDEIATFSTVSAAQKNMRDRHVDYGELAQIFDCDTATVVLETTNEGKIWYDPAHAWRLTAKVPA